MSVEALTYAPPGTRLTASPEAARSLAGRGRKPRSLSTDGNAQVGVRLAEIRHMPPPPRGGEAGDIARLAAKIAALKAEIARLDARVELLQDTETMAAKDMTARREAEVLPTGGRNGDPVDSHEQAARRLGRLAATIVQADRKACG